MMLSSRDADSVFELPAVHLRPLKAVREPKTAIRSGMKFFIIEVGLRDKRHIWRGVYHHTMALTGNGLGVQIGDCSYCIL